MIGRPLSALNSLTQFGSSWLSREIRFTATFTGLTFLTALLIL
ncbi:DmsC/YnfH family molybdoenzyme membrane anchor subunit [Desulfitobacterium sp.]|nr:DmsC/YnfH family molybdoenzyme membrane anchor subunit [Desulfitobacterium sp.]MEA4902574.1 DmsC/YnfH family molybdoenzyme membrane anchor subunit [Desulfitobacterium sp.]